MDVRSNSRVAYLTFSLFYCQYSLEKLYRKNCTGDSALFSPAQCWTSRTPTRRPPSCRRRWSSGRTARRTAGTARRTRTPRSWTHVSVSSSPRPLTSVLASWSRPPASRWPHEGDGKLDGSYSDQSLPVIKIKKKLVKVAPLWPMCSRRAAHGKKNEAADANQVSGHK